MSRTTKVNRILICRTDRMGDMIVSTILLQYLKQYYPSAHFFIVCSPCNSKVLEFDDRVTLIIFRKEAQFREKFKLFWRVRKIKPDISICLSPGYFSFFCAALTGASKRLTFSNSKRKKNRFLKLLVFTHCSKTTAKRKRPIEKMRFIGLDFLSVLEGVIPIPAADDLADLYISRDARVQNILPVGQTFGIHLDGRWVEDGVAESAIIDMLVQLQSRVGKPLVISYEVDHYPSLREKLSDSYFFQSSVSGLKMLTAHLLESSGKFFLFDRPDFQVWASLIESCQFWITIEGGSQHVAGAMKTPVVVLVRKCSESRYEMQVREWVAWKNPFTVRRWQETENVPTNLLNAAVDEMLLLQQ